MPSAPPSPLSQIPAEPRWGWLALGYALLVLYASTAVGPNGMEMLPVTLERAVWRFTSMAYSDLGSDQRADWMGNLGMLIPLGYLTAAALAARRASVPGRLAGGLGAWLLCLLYILAVKFAQLWFPRTVTLNYILAQTLGASAGVALQLLGHGLFRRAWAEISGATRRGLLWLLGAYALGVLVFMLAPYDIVLSRADIQDRIQALPGQLLAMPGAGRPGYQRVMILAGNVGLLVPVGAWLRLLAPALPGWRVLARGLALLAGATALSFCVISAAPSLAAVALRAVGLGLGVLAVAVLARQDARLWARALPALALLAIPAYVLVLATAKGLARLDWRGPEAVVEILLSDPRHLLPGWSHYIVSKAQAIKSVGVHVVMYAPVGLFFWVFQGPGRGVMAGAGFTAFLLAGAVEAGRAMGPGVTPDFNNCLVAAAAAAMAVPGARILWTMLTGLSHRVPSAAPASMPPARPRPVVEEPAAPALGLALLLAGLAVAWFHPLAPVWVALGLALYGAILWRWPGAWLLLLPALLPVADLAPWTGWLLVGEADLLVLITLGMLCLRVGLTRADIWPRGPMGAALAAFAALALVALARGLLVPGPDGGTENILLSPWNGARMAKALVFALALAPFLRARQRHSADGLALFAHGIVLGLLLLGVAVVVERLAFPGLWELGGDYRVSALFSSMHIGGGHIGAYLAMSLPFLAAPLLARRVTGWVLVAGAGTLGVYALVVGFARTAYAAALLGLLVTAMGLVFTAWGRVRGGRVAAVLAALALAVGAGGGVVLLGGESRQMAGRLAQLAPDFAERLDNWARGLMAHDGGLAATMLGMGTGTYPRLAHAAHGARAAPSNFSLIQSDNAPALRLDSRGPFYFGQKLNVAPGESLRVSLRVRAGNGVGLTFGMCEKWLLFSADCAVARHRVGGDWETISLALTVPGRERVVPRTVEFWLNIPPGTVLDLARASLRGGDGREVLANGDFRDGTASWFFTDDGHGSWRIFNQFAMAFFEGGGLGLVALLGLFAAAMAAAWRACRQGARLAACAGGAVVAFGVSCLFDAQLEAPRVALLFYLIVLAIPPQQTAVQTPGLSLMR